MSGIDGETLSPNRLPRFSSTGWVYPIIRIEEPDSLLLALDFLEPLRAPGLDSLCFLIEFFLLSFFI